MVFATICYLKTKAITYGKKNTYKLKTFQTYFQNYCIIKTEKKIHNKNIYNFDKTRFQVGTKKD